VNSQSHTDLAGLAGELLEIIRQLLSELHPEQHLTLSLDSVLDRDLGLDSLARIELLLRCEKQFAVSLPEQLFATMETPRDLLQAVLALEPEEAEEQFRHIATTPDAMETGEPARATTLIEALAWHIERHPERTHLLLYGQKGAVEEEISYAKLWQGAAAVCAGLRYHGLNAGEQVAIMLPTGRDFFFSFYGILMAGATPVPIYPPMRLKQVEDHMQRQSGILNNARAKMLITFDEIKPLARIIKPQVESLSAVVTVEELSQRSDDGERPALHAHDTALLQYTSGSTGNPKGVVLSHTNLLANIRAMGQAANVTPQDVFVSWLPLYHDMGLIGACLGSMYYAMPLVLMSPLSFIARPQRWLKAIHDHRGTLSPAPNFAYELCMRISDDSELAGLDLSSWRMAFNGAEPVSPNTIERFSNRFADYGFNRQAFSPVYGLAESSVGLAFSPPGRGPLIDTIRRDSFVRQGKAVPAVTDEKTPLRFVACGRPLSGHQIRIVDTTGREVGEREEGKLQFTGPSVTSGYFRNQSATAKLYDGDWLDSGDYAYMAAGDIYITGRAKDIIIRAGRNIYPQELEDAVGNIERIRKGCVAAFASPDPNSGTERLIIMAESREKEPQRLEEMRVEINALAVGLLGAPPDEVVLVPPSTALKTSSGKIRRAACRELFEQGNVGRQVSSGRLQLLRLALASAAPQCRRGLRVATDNLYAAYAWLLFLLSASTTWLITLLLPGMALRRRFVRTAARLFLRLSGTPLIVHGEENLPKTTPCVVVSNHASYLDGIILTAALPPTLAYVAKLELKSQLIPRLFLNRIGTAYVERFDVQKGVEDTERILKIIEQGQSLAIMPEGTFRRASGLRPFHMGAFVIAAKALVPVIPVAIRGSRSILRANSLFPRRGAISIVIGEPIRPENNEWSDAVALRDAAHRHILRHCGEPDLQNDGSNYSSVSPE
jgi:1-acyl-sn-glycerol-3-phosphate acyltransferase